MPKGIYPRKKGYKLSLETRKKMSESKKGKKNYFFGKTHTEKSRKLISLHNIGKKAGEKNPFYGKKHSKETINLLRKYKLGKVGYWKGKIRPPFSEEWKRKISESGRNIHSASKHWNWKGGITKLHELIRHSWKYKNWRSEIFRRDNWTCQLCGIRSGKGHKTIIQADHYPKLFVTIIQENKINSLVDAWNCEELWKLEIGRTLCRKCHNKKHQIVQYNQYGYLENR